MFGKILAFAAGLVIGDLAVRSKFMTTIAKTALDNVVDLKAQLNDKTKTEE